MNTYKLQDYKGAILNNHGSFSSFEDALEYLQDNFTDIEQDKLIICKESHYMGPVSNRDKV
jgi:hypothetical protein